MQRYGPGARLAGLDELLVYLEKLEGVYRRSTRLGPIAFLIIRAHADFCTAIEASLSGYFSVAMDAMRDVMEIEFLLREFYFEPAQIDAWVSCDDRERWKKFRPAILRTKYAARLGERPEDLSDAADYRGHSMFLHVSPLRSPFGGPGLLPPTVPFGDDACFWELYEHGRRLAFGLHALRRNLARRVPGPPGPSRGLPKFKKGWERTQEMQAISIAFVKVMNEPDAVQQGAAAVVAAARPRG